jgi:hypothetical protein
MQEHARKETIMTDDEILGQSLTHRPDMSAWKTLPQISLDLDKIKAKAREVRAKLDELGWTEVARGDLNMPCPDCEGGYYEGARYIPHDPLCPAHE